MRTAPLLLVGLVLAGSTARAQDQAVQIPADLADRLADLLAEDWDGRPDWADMATAILSGGETMGQGNGWFRPATKRFDFGWLRNKYDKSPADGKIRQQELPEFVSDADFRILDRNLSGSLDARDFDWSAGNYLMEGNAPSQPVFHRLDLDGNGRITRDEMNRFFDRYAGGFDFLTPDDLRAGLKLPTPRPVNARRQSPRMPPQQRWQMLDMLLHGALGGMKDGPKLDDDAPDFRLQRMERDEETGEMRLSGKFARLSDSKGHRPVVLIFGSFT